ncbi:MAG: outer membrane beta-barrel protein [Xanthobacteraceae bacterium]|nr:outer membrane beta-barrel protein [Xanthobacteraceae bacterium]
MKKLVLAVSALALSAVSASAADLAARPYTKAPVAPLGYDWSGFYVGANGGGGWVNNAYSDALSGITDGSNTGSGAIAGGQVGWRTQASWLVWGFDLTGDWAGIKGSNTSAGFNPGTVWTTKTNGLFTIAATAGYAVNNVLLYAKGGGGWTSNTVSEAVTATSLYEARWGALLGAGIEYGLTPNWTIGVEYNHYFLGAVTDAVGPAAATTGERVSQNGLDTVTARLNYKFGGPIVARY